MVGMILTHINSNVPQNIRHTFFAHLKVKLFNVLCHDVIREVQDKIPQPMSTSNLLNTSWSRRENKDGYKSQNLTILVSNESRPSIHEGFAGN